MESTVLTAFGINKNECDVAVLGSGLINHTWKITNGTKEYLLQSVNHNIFKQPNLISENINQIAAYLKKNFPDYLFVSSIKNIENEDLVRTANGDYFRLFPFIKKSHTIDVVENPNQAFEAAKQFGLFTKNLSGFNAKDLNITLSDFHNLSLRYQQFETALENGRPERIANAANEIALLKNYKNIVDEFEKIKLDKDFKIRVTHHDTKISNVLFDEKNKGLCVIDLDTVMPGYFISDLGDMFRTYLSPVSEEEKDFSKIKIRKEFLDAIIEGYLSQMQDELTEKEKQYFIYSGKFMIYMQALRFLTDYLNGDIYYGQKYEGHNLMRAINQRVLLEKLAMG